MKKLFLLVPLILIMTSCHQHNTCKQDTLDLTAENAELNDGKEFLCAALLESEAARRFGDGAVVYVGDNKFISANGEVVEMENLIGLCDNDLETYIQTVKDRKSFLDACDDGCCDGMCPGTTGTTTGD